MILRSVAVEAWGPFLRRAAIEDLSDRVNLIVGPNEAGKSTIARAIARGLLDRHGVAGEEIEAIRPWGRDLGPRIEIVFEHGGARYRLSKRFLKAPSSLLEREEGGRFVPFAEGEGAEAHVRELLGATLPGRGLAKAEHWGIGQVLWAPQGEIRIDTVSAGAGERLRRALGAVASGGEGARIEARIEEAYAKLFTPTGRPRRGRDSPLFVRLAEDLERLDAEVAAAREEAEAFARASRTVLEAREKREALTRGRERARERLRALERDAARYEEIDRERARIEGELAARRAEYEALRARIEEIASLGARAGECAREIEEVSAEIPRLEALRLAALGEEATGIERRIERLREAHRALAEAREARGAIAAPTREELGRLRAILAARDEARVRLEACAVSIEIEAERAIDVEGPDEGERRTLAPGGTLRASGIGEVEVRVPGLGRIRARSATPPPDEIRRALEEAEARIRTLCDPYGTCDPAALEERCARADELDARIRAREADRRAILGEREEEDLLGDLDRAREEAEAIRRLHPEWRGTPPEVERAGLVSRETAAALARARARREALAAELSRIEARRAELEGDGLDRARRAKALDDLALAIHALSEGLKAKRAEIDAFGEDPRRARETLAAEIEATEAAEREALEEENRAKGILDEKAGKGTHDRLARAEEARAIAAARLRRERVRAEGIRLLREAVLRAREALVADLIAPVEREVAVAMGRLVGERYDAVRIGSGFVPAGICARGEAVPLDLLSRGTEEQLFFLVRLALAKAIASEDREALILDDPLLNTDPDRMGRALLLIEEAAERLQVLLFTCHGDRYAALRGAKRYELAPPAA